MFPSLDTTCAVLAAERATMLKRAEYRALLSEASKRPRSVPADAPAVRATVRVGRLARAIHSLRGELRPSRA